MLRGVGRGVWAGAEGPSAWQDWPSVPGYRIEHLLGQGGTSAVYRAVREATDDVVALKVLSLDHGDLGAALARLEREAHIGRRLVHPDIVPVLDFGQDGHRAWIAMELLDGFELTHALADPSFLFKDRMNVILRVAAALHHAHEQGVVHRDLKPSNIFMTREGGVRLLDFGIAHVKVDLRLTRSGVMVGTPRYMAPEQVTGGDIDPRTDVFSLGVVLYQVLCGALPWEGDTIARLIIAVATQPARPLQEALPEGAYGLDAVARARLAEVVHRALATEPADRYPTMRDFAGELGLFIDAPQAAGPTTGAPVAAWSQRRVDWALARAARLHAEAAVVKGEGGARGPPTLDQTLSRRGEGVWLGLVALFVLALGGALWLAVGA